MNSILQITETDKNITNQLMEHNQAWAKLLEELKDAFNIQNATQGDLATAIAQLRAALHTIQPSSGGGGITSNDITFLTTNIIRALNSLVTTIEQRLPDPQKPLLHNQILNKIVSANKINNTSFFGSEVFDNLFNWNNTAVMRHDDDTTDTINLSAGISLASHIISCSNIPKSQNIQNSFIYNTQMQECMQELQQKIMSRNEENIETLNNMLDQWNQKYTVDTSKQITLKQLLPDITYKDALCDEKTLEDKLTNGNVKSLNSFIEKYKKNNNEVEVTNEDRYTLKAGKDTLDLREAMRLINKICHQIYDITFDALYNGDIPGENTRIA